MVSKTITFNYRYEIDIYFAEKIMKKAREFESKIQMECDGRGLTSLSRLKLSCLIKMGSKVTIYADGIDEKEALEAISSLLEIVAEEDISKQEIELIDEQEEREEEINKSPEEIENDLEKIVEETAVKEVEFKIGKKIEQKQRDTKNTIFSLINKDLYYLAIAGPDLDAKTRMERIWEVMVYKIEKKFKIKNSMWTIVPAMKKRIESIVKEDIKNRNIKFPEHPLIPYYYVYFTVPSSTISQVTRAIGKSYIVSLKNMLKYESSGKITVPTYKEFMLDLIGILRCRRLSGDRCFKTNFLCLSYGKLK